MPNATPNQTTNASIVAVKDDIMNFLRRRQTVQLYAASANAPIIIDRPSTATKGPPFCDRGMTIVASAIEGAAPNKPAKLFGRNVSLNAANAGTAMPPAINRKRYSNIDIPYYRWA